MSAADDAHDDRAAGAFGAALRRHRRAAGLTQEALAEQAGVSARAVSDLERGLARAPHRDTLARLSDALGLGGDEANALGASVERRRGPPARPSGRGAPEPWGAGRGPGRHIPPVWLTSFV